jgi:hypothetical protein
MVDGLTLRPALPSDHRTIEDLFRATSMGSAVRIRIERDPDYFTGASIQAEEPCVWAAFDPSGRAVGVFSAGKRRVRLNGEIIPMRYLADLRIHPEFRGSSLLARGFALLRKEVFAPGEWAQTLVLEENQTALTLLTSGRGGLPVYKPSGRYSSFLIRPQRLARVPGVEVRPARPDDIAAMQALLDEAGDARAFSPVLDLSQLGSPAWCGLSLDDFMVAECGNSLVGMLALWDQSRFQRMTVSGYSRGVSLLRPLWNRLAAVRLPPVGGEIRVRKASAIACRRDDPVVLRALLQSALELGDPRLILLGMSAVDPLLPALHGLKARQTWGRHFLVGWQGHPPPWREPFAFDVARI